MHNSHTLYVIDPFGTCSSRQTFDNLMNTIEAPPRHITPEETTTRLSDTCPEAEFLFCRASDPEEIERSILREMPSREGRLWGVIFVCDRIFAQQIQARLRQTDKSQKHRQMASLRSQVHRELEQIKQDETLSASAKNRKMTALSQAYQRRLKRLREQGVSDYERRYFVYAQSLSIIIGSLRRRCAREAPVVGGLFRVEREQVPLEDGHFLKDLISLEDARQMASPNEVVASIFGLSMEEMKKSGGRTTFDLASLQTKPLDIRELCLFSHQVEIYIQESENRRNAPPQPPRLPSYEAAFRGEPAAPGQKSKRTGWSRWLRFWDSR